MLDPLTALDAGLLRTYGAAANLAGRWYGMTVPRLVAGCAPAAVAFYVLHVVFRFYEIPHDTYFWAGLVVTPLLCLALVMWSRELAANAERWPNPNMMSLFGFRLIWLNFIALDLLPKYNVSGILYGLSDIAITSMLYLASLPPAPPREVREPKAASVPAA